MGLWWLWNKEIGMIMWWFSWGCLPCSVLGLLRRFRESTLSNFMVTEYGHIDAEVTGARRSVRYIETFEGILVVKCLQDKKGWLGLARSNWQYVNAYYN